MTTSDALHAVLWDPERLLALRASGLLDTPPDPTFDRWTRLVRRVLEADVSLITLLDGDRQFFKSASGLTEPWATLRQTPLSHSFCQYVVAGEATLVVADAREDPTLRYNRAIPDLGVVAYLGVPLRTRQGALLGSLSAIQSGPREWTEREVEILEGLAAAVSMEIELRALEERARVLTASVSEIIIILDESGRLVYHSPSFAARLGHDPGVRIDGSLLRFVHSSDREPFRRAVRRVTAVENRVETLSFRLLLPSGPERVLEARLSNLLAAPAIRGLLLVARDVTERRHLEAQFLQAQKMEAVGRLAGGIAHDFNNLLTVIGGAARFLLEDSDQGDAGRGDLEEIGRAAERAGELTRQLLAFSRQQILHPHPVDLNEVLREGQRMLRRIIGEDIAIELRLTDRPCRVFVDPIQIEQVVINLLVNARDAMPDGGRITVTTRVEAAHHPGEGPGSGTGDATPGGAVVVLELSDTGTGMDEATQAKAFEPFFTTKETGKGTGLGLSTVYGIVQQSGGTISVRSHPGDGTTFTIRLPWTQEAAASHEREDDEPVRPATGGVILVVEDEQSVRRLVERVLTRDGHKVLAAADGETALQVAGSVAGGIDLVVTDLVMPGIGGLELATRLRTRASGPRVLYMSGHDPEASLQGRRVPAQDRFLQKPFTPAQLSVAVAHALAQPAGLLTEDG